MKFFLYSLLLVLLGVKLPAQDMPYINYTTHNGLPQIQVQRLFQDSKGYIWVGTKGGLAKFSGEKFEHFLYNDYIYEMNETLSGTMVFLTIDSVYRQDRGKMKAIGAVKRRSYLIAGEDSFWTINKQELKEYRQDTLYQTIKKGVDIFDELLSAVYDRAHGQLLFVTQNKNALYSLKDKKLTKIANFNTYRDIGAFSDGTIFHVVPSSDSEYTYINPETKETYFSYKIVANEFVFTEINEIPVKRHLVSNFLGYHFYLIDSLTQSAAKIQTPVKKEVCAFLIDRDDNYWLGTDNGLYQVNNKSFKVYPREFMNDFWTIIRGKDEKFYAGVYKRGLFQLDFENQKKKEIKARGAVTPIENNYYYGSSMDKQGNLYFPTHYGLVKYNYKKAKKFDTGVSLISKYDPQEDKVVFGQEHGIGFIDNKERIQTYTDSTNKLITFHPSALEFKPNGDILIGNRAGLVLFNKQNRQLETAAKYYKVYPTQPIVSMAKDHKSNVWIGGKSELWLYDSQKENFTHIGKAFFNTSILSILSPDSTLLLIGTSYEIFAMRLDKFYEEGKIEFKMFNYRNGFFSEEVAQNGFLQDGNKVLIPSSTTTSVLDYKKISFSPEFFNVWVTKINDKGLCCKEQLNQKVFAIPRGENRLDVEFESVGFGLPTKSCFKYKLEGVDTKWSDWSERKKVHYSGLSSGKYTFYVKALNGNNIEPIQEKQAAVSLLISLPFYKEPNFYKYAFFAFLLIIILTAYFFWRAYRNKIAMQDREQKIKLLEIATLQAQINPHFIFNFLSSIQSLINQRMPEKANDYLVKFSRLIRSYMESSIKSSKILSGSTLGNENSIKEEIDLLNTYIELEKLKYAEGKISHTIILAEDAILNKTIPPMILQPFVENAIKHGILPKKEGGTVRIAFTQEENNLVCKVEDDGIGRKLSTEINKQSIRAYKSRGLQLIKNRVEMLNKLDYNITIDFEDPEAGGTIVTIKIQN